MKNGGAITFRGQHLYVYEAYAKENEGFRGGFIFVDCLRSKYQSVIMRNSVLNANRGGNGGVIGFTGEVKHVDIFIADNYFTKNEGSSKIKKIKFQKSLCLIILKI